MVSWLNNTWNIKWIKEGNFEMGILAFANKTGYVDGKKCIWTAPAQMWWQYAWLNGSEILIGSMHAAWFGFDDLNLNKYYDTGEYISPFFYLGMNTEEVIDTGVVANPSVDFSPL